MVGSQASWVSRATPPGLAKPVAVLAWSLVWPMPTAQVSWVRSSTLALMRAATSSGSAVVTPRNASSQPSTSTGAPNERRVSITSSEAAS